MQFQIAAPFCVQEEGHDLAFDPVYIMALLALLAVFIKERSRLFDLRWRPDRSTAAAIFGALAIFALSGVLAADVGLPVRQFVLHVGLYALLGVVVAAVLGLPRGRDWLCGPWNYAAEPAPVARHKSWGARSVSVRSSHSGRRLERHRAGHILRAALFVLLTGNFFELIFYYGFVHLRLREAFGPLSAIFGTSFLYVLWHTGTELMLVDHPFRVAAFLFVVGVLYQSVFALTRNLAIIFPFFVGAGVMLDFTVNIEALEAVAPFVGWSLIAWALFALGFAICPFIARHQRHYTTAAGQSVRE